jgi:hypothetical protein
VPFPSLNFVCSVPVRERQPDSRQQTTWFGKGTTSEVAEKLKFEQGSGRARIHSCRKVVENDPRFSACGMLLQAENFSALAEQKRDEFRNSWRRRMSFSASAADERVLDVQSIC